jgi:hypothetical protein
LQTCNLVWKDGVEDFSLFFLLFDTHLCNCPRIQVTLKEVRSSNRVDVPMMGVYTLCGFSVAHTQIWLRGRWFFMVNNRRFKRG